MYRLATIHLVTDRQTDRRQSDANSLQQYDWLKRQRSRMIVFVSNHRLNAEQMTDCSRRRRNSDI